MLGQGGHGGPELIARDWSLLLGLALSSKERAGPPLVTLSEEARGAVGSHQPNTQGRQAWYVPTLSSSGAGVQV